MSVRWAFIAVMVVLAMFGGATPVHGIIVCPSVATPPQGVDVSSWQGTVNWGQVAASGVVFAYTCVSNGLSPDATFSGNYASIRAVGMLRGAYQIFRPSQDPIAQANLLLAGIGTLAAGDLPPALEVDLTDGLSASTIGAQIRTWVTTVQYATGRAPIILTGRSFWDGSVVYPGSAPDLLWVAHWRVTCPNLPDAWFNWKFWQYTDMGTVPGITGNVTRDEFNGPFSDLQLLAGAASAAPLPASTLKMSIFPNPFNPRTTIKYELPEAGSVRLAVLDLAGRLVRTLVDESRPQGSFEVAWDGRDSTGKEVSSGTYLARLSFGGRVEAVRMGLIR